MRKLILIFVATMLLASCKDATTAQFNALGKRHHIKLYSGGKVVGEWESTGNISNEKNSDGWYFEDARTGKLVELAGTMSVEQEDGYSNNDGYTITKMTTTARDSIVFGDTLFGDDRDDKRAKDAAQKAYSQYISHKHK